MEMAREGRKEMQDAYKERKEANRQMKTTVIAMLEQLLGATRNDPRHWFAVVRLFVEGIFDTCGMVSLYYCLTLIEPCTKKRRTTGQLCTTSSLKGTKQDATLGMHAGPHSF